MILGITILLVKIQKVGLDALVTIVGTTIFKEKISAGFETQKAVNHCPTWLFKLPKSQFGGKYRRPKPKG